MYRASVPLGYVEAKDVDVDLGKTERTEQLKRYREAFPNLILTDYLEFRRYVDGERRETARIAEPDATGKLRPDKEGQKEAERLLRAFVNAEAPVVGSPRDLAARMAALSRQIRDLIRSTFEKEGERGQLHVQLDAFQDTLIPGLSSADFADMYAQTIAYGLFAARISTDKPHEFSRKTAVFDLPRTNPFLRSLFGEIAGPDLDERVAWVVDDLAELLRRSRMDAILADFGGRTRREDPVVHFYETFLAAYDPKMREARGVYYTPEPVVGYIVRSVDAVLKSRFGRATGLADPDTRILDPATGTATFLYYVIRHVYESLQSQGQLGTWSAYVREELLPRLFGFELLMAPYAVAHMKLSVLLRELGYDFFGEERLGVYLTNTLEEGDYSQPTGFAEYIAREANAATEVKNEEPIEVILGNPPYSGHSSNKGDWIRSLVNEDYIKLYPELRKPTQAKWLSDDYVKFIRFGQWRVDRTGRGVLAFVTNHGYLDNPTFRGMRRSLMHSFTDIYLLDLHGNKKKKERTPEGGKDQNVFDIQQGVSIGIFVKEPSKQGPARVHYADLWGEWESKYEWLSNQSMQTTEWEEIDPTPPNYLFVPQLGEGKKDYESWWKITDVMPWRGLGLQSSRDHLVIGFIKAELEQRIALFADSSRSDEDTRASFFPNKSVQKYLPGDTRQWSLSAARGYLREDVNWRKNIRPFLYRPFDHRYILHDSRMVDWPRPQVTGQLNYPNYSLVTGRQGEAAGSETWDVLFTASSPVDHNVYRRGGNVVFPLYIYPAEENMLDAMEEHREPNISPEFTRDLVQRLGLEFVADGSGDLTHTFGPENVFHYAYAVFHSPEYRERYAEFLKRDFPRLPLTSDRDLFAALAAKGGELVGLHLMRSPALDSFITRFPETGDNVVDKVSRDGEDRVYINSGQYFDGVPEEAWEFRVGGYQVLDKWLKDRKGRALTSADIRHYQRIVVALTETQRLMWEIDETIPGWPLE